jgi:hypothetical protein
MNQTASGGCLLSTEGLFQCKAKAHNQTSERLDIGKREYVLAAVSRESLQPKSPEHSKDGKWHEENNDMKGEGMICLRLGVYMRGDRFLGWGPSRGSNYCRKHEGVARSSLSEVHSFLK